MAVAPDGRTLAAFSSRGSLRAWDVGDLSQGARALPPLRWRHGTPKGITFLPDARTVLTLSSEGSALAWDLAPDSQPPQPLRAPFGTDVLEWQLAADNRTITATADGAVKSAPREHIPIRDQALHAGAETGQRALLEGWPMVCRRFDQRQGRGVERPGAPPDPGVRQPSRPATSLRFSPDGGTLMVLDAENERVTNGISPRHGNSARFQPSTPRHFSGGEASSRRTDGIR